MQAAKSSVLRHAAVRPVAAAILVPALLFGISRCRNDQGPEGSDFNYVPWSSSSSCLIRKAQQPTLKICIQGQGDLVRAQDLAGTTLRQWLDALEPVAEGITQEIVFGCDQADAHVNVMQGSGRAYASPGKINIYNLSKHGTYLHEWGHAFACLGDTYVGSAAGVCQSGQPHSIMCDGLLRNDLSDDDVEGVRYQLSRLLPQANPVDPAADEDDDGVANEADLCPHTTAGVNVWKETTGPNAKWLGCAGGQTPIRQP